MTFLAALLLMMTGEYCIQRPDWGEWYALGGATTIYYGYHKYDHDTLSWFPHERGRHILSPEDILASDWIAKPLEQKGGDAT